MTAGQAAGGRPLPVTVVIPTFNRAADLPRSIGSLAAQRGTGLRVIVVDNSSSDPTEEVIRSLQPAWEGRLDYVRKEPQGPASARNRGLAAATTPYVMFMDSDVEVPPDWIPNALAHLEADPSLAAAGGLILYAFDPTRVNAYGGDLGVSGLAWDVEEGTLREVARRPEDRIWINCSAMLVRTEALRRVDGFDDAYFYGYEDSDVGWRLNLAGERVAVFPDLAALHHVAWEPGTANPTIVFHYCKNRLRMLLRNASPARLPLMLAVYGAYTAADLVIRPYRGAKLRALGWNLARLRETLRLRRATQRSRRTTDAVVFARGSGHWFPPTRLAGLRRRAVAPPADPSKVATRPAVDDRV